MSETFLRIRTIMEKAHEYYEREVKFYKVIREMLAEKFTGKRVDTKRTLTYINSLHPTWTVCFQTVGSHTNLRVWGGDSGYKDHNDYGRVMLGYDNELHVFDPNKMDEHNAWIKANERSIVRIESILDDPNLMRVIADNIDRLNEQRESLLKMIESIPEQSEIEKLIKK